MRISELEQLVIRQIPSLRRYARALTHDTERADDLVQDCLERAWRRIGSWRREGDIRPWLFTIMHNVFANDARRYSRAQLVPLPAVDLPDDHPPAHETDLNLRDLKAALETLPIEQRQVILLIGLENLRYDEVARILGVPIGTVMSRLSRGRARLRQQLAGESQSPLTRVK